MTAFNGKATLCVGDEIVDVALTLDLNERRIVTRHARPSTEDQEYLRRALTGETPTVAHLSNIEIQTPNGLVRAQRIDSLIVAQSNHGASGVDDSLLTRSLSLFESNTGVVTHTLIPSSSLIEFEHQPLTCTDSEILYTGDISSVHPYEFTVEDSLVRVVGDRKQLKVQSGGTLWDKERRVRLAASLLLGVRVSPLAAYEDGVLRINLAKEGTYKKGHRLCDDPALSGSLFEHLLRFLVGLSEPDFRHWNKACSFLLEGKAGHTELDIGLVNLFVFLEMRDNSGTLSANTIGPLLGISPTDAKLVCKVRNRLIHQSDMLNDAVMAADAELRSNESNYALRWFDLSGARHSPGVMLAFRLYERINRYLCELIGWSKGFNRYENVLGTAHLGD